MKTLFDLELEVYPELKNLPISEIPHITDKRRLFEPTYKDFDIDYNHAYELLNSAAKKNDADVSLHLKIIH